MPNSPLRPCTSIGCMEMVRHGRCAKHQQQRYRDQDDRRGSSSQRGYDATWRRLRQLVLADEPLCRHCLQQGKLMPAAEVDHIKPIADGGERLDRANLQPLCKACHSRKTLAESVRGT